MKRDIKLLRMSLIIAFVLCAPFYIFAQKSKGKTTSKAKPKTQTVSKSSAADNLFEEGLALFKQATAQSYQAALPKFAQAAELYEKINDAESQADSYIFIGRAYSSLGNYNQAFENYKSAVEIYQRIGNLPGQAIAWNNVGIIYRDNSNFPEAIKAYQTAVNLMRQSKNKDGEAKSLNGLGESILGTGNVNEAMPYLQQALSIWQSLGANEDRVRTVFNLGRGYFAQGDFNKGLNYLQQALNDSRQYNNPILEGDILEAMAEYYFEKGQLAKAIELRKQIFTAFRNSKASTVTPSRTLMSLNNLIVSNYRGGDFESGIANINEGINFATQRNETFVLAYLYSNNGDFLIEQGKYQEAIPTLNKAIAISKQTGDKYIEAATYLKFGLVYLNLKDFDQAENYFIQAKQLIPQGNSFFVDLHGRILAGQIFLGIEVNDKGKISEYINEGQRIGVEKSGSQGAMEFLTAVGTSQLFEGKKQEAIQTYNKAFQLADLKGHEIQKAKIQYHTTYANLQIGNAQSALQSAQASHDFFKRIGNDQMDMNTHIQMASGLIQMNQLQPAFQNLNSALEFAQKLNDSESLMVIYFRMAEVNRQGQSFDNAIQYYNQAFQLAENTDDRSSQKLILNEMGDTFEKKGDKKKAKEYRDKAKKIRN